jgi:hypothetical protein
MARAPQVRSAPRQAMTPRNPRNVQRGPTHVARPRGNESGPAVVRRGEPGRVSGQARQGDRTVGRGPDNRGRGQNANPSAVTRQATGNRDLTPRTARAPALAGDRNAAIRSSVLRNRAFADPGARNASSQALSRATFRGRFAERDGRFADRRGGGRFWRHGFVIGWIGPVFWPYAYDDFVDYTFSSYAYDTFWPYAYDDVYVSIFPFAASGSAYANVPAYGGGGGTRVRVPPNGVAQVCSEQASGLTDWPIERIAQAVEPDEAQRTALMELKDATAKVVELMKSACPTDLPSTPTGRLAAMRTRIETMLQAVAVVRPALERFYNSLNDEQKARFNALSEEQPAARSAQTAGRQGPDLTQVCSGQVTGSLPIDRVRQAEGPTEDQRAALDELDQASRKAAELLKASCNADQSLTPTGRLEAMEQRLNAMLQALNTVQPALERFYSSLSDEQKARFNRIGTQEARRR